MILHHNEKVALITAGNEVEAMQWANSAGADEASAATLEENGMGISSDVSSELEEVMKAVAAELEVSWLELAGDEGSAILEIFRK